MLKQNGKNVHNYKVATKKRNHRHVIYDFSDLHWDNPKCKRDLLKKHLDQALEENARVILNGDTFCLMQGKYDPRKSKASILPEHNVNNYLDAVIETAVEWFKPYAEIIDVVGYGNHECYREDTEVLTARGWVNIKDVKLDDKVATFNKNSIYFENPNAIVSKQVEKLVHIETSYSKQIVSGKHAVVLNDLSKVNAEDITTLKDKDLPYGMKLESNNRYDSDTVELITCVVMDATLVDYRKYVPDSIKRRVQFKISKPEKIEYIKSVLEDNNISYTFKKATKSGVNKLQPYMINVYGADARYIFHLLNDVKQLPNDFKNLTGDCYEAFKHALINTDGHKKGEVIQWSTTSKNDIDIVQQMCVYNGEFLSFKAHENRSGFGKGKTQYISRIAKTIKNNRNAEINHEDINTTVYCLNMPSGRFVTRIDGKVAYSGNTSILRRQETDMVQRFVDLINITAKPKNKVCAGGYGGWYITTIDKTPYKIKYFHGSGGGGVVTRGEINLTRLMSMVEGADCITIGHVHENKETFISKECLSGSNKIELRDVMLLITGTYKEEYNDQYMGWHVERGAPPKVIGGRKIILDYHRPQQGKPFIKATSVRL